MSEATLNNRLSELYRLTLKFLHVIETEKDDIKYHSNILNQLNSRKLFPNSHSAYMLSVSKVSPYDLRHAPSYLEYLRSVSDYYRGVNNFEECLKFYNTYNNYFTSYAMITIMNYSFDYMTINHPALDESRNKFLEVCKSIDFESVLKAWGNDVLYKPVAAVYYLVEAFRDSGDEGKYLKAYGYFCDSFEEFPDIMKEDLYLKFQSFCTMMLMKENKKYFNHYLNIIKHKIEKGRKPFTGLNQFPFSEYHDIVVVALQSGEYDWAERFIKDYSYLLDPEIRKHETLIALAALNIKKQDYLAVRDHIEKFGKSKNIYYNFEIYMYKVIVNYELNLSDKLKNSIENLQYYLRKHRKSDHLNFDKVCKFSHYAAQLSEIGTKSYVKVKDLLLSLKNDKHSFPHKKWVLQKVEDYAERMSE